MAKTKITSIRLPQELKDRAEKAASEKGHTLSQFIYDAIRYYLKHSEHG